MSISFDAGYDWVISVSKSGGKSIAEIEQHIQEAKDFDDYTDFDRGAEEAVKELEKGQK